MIKSIIIAVYVVFLHSGGIAVTSEANHWNFNSCQEQSKMEIQDYEASHQGDKVEYVCMRIVKGGL